MVTCVVIAGTAAPLLFLASLGLERGQPVEWNRNAIGSLVFLAVLAGAAGYAIYFWLLQQLEAYQVEHAAMDRASGGDRSRAPCFCAPGLSFSMIAGSAVALVCLMVVMRARARR